MFRRLTHRLFDSPLIRRIQFYARRARGQLDRRFFVTLVEGILAIVAIAAVLITLLEKDWTLASIGSSFYWGLTTVLGQGDPSFITSPAGWLISWLLILFGVALFGTITGALIAIVIDFLLKEGQGMGASGYEGHVVVCGWNSTARDLIAELRSDAYKVKIVVIAPLDKNPAGDGVYFVKGDPTDPADLERAGLEKASAALIFPVDESNDADMRSILTVIAIESVAPEVRTVAEVNNPRHADHFRRARVDELLVSSQVGARLLARSALYPGLTELVADIVSGGDGSELYRVEIPDDYLGLSVDAVSARLRAEHRATLLSISRNGKAFVNPPADFVIARGDDAVVVAESLGTLAPLVLKHEENGTGVVAAVAEATTAAVDVAATAASTLTEGVASAVGTTPESAAAPAAGPGRADGTGASAPASSAPPPTPASGPRPRSAARARRLSSAQAAPIAPQAVYQPPAGPTAEATGSAVGIAAPPATTSAMAPLVSVVSAPASRHHPGRAARVEPAADGLDRPDAAGRGPRRQGRQAQEEARQALSWREAPRSGDRRWTVGVRSG